MPVFMPGFTCVLNKGFGFGFIKSLVSEQPAFAEHLLAPQTLSLHLPLQQPHKLKKWCPCLIGQEIELPKVTQRMNDLESLVQNSCLMHPFCSHLWVLDCVFNKVLLLCILFLFETRYYTVVARPAAPSAL